MSDFECPQAQFERKIDEIWPENHEIRRKLARGIPLAMNCDERIAA